MDFIFLLVLSIDKIYTPLFNTAINLESSLLKNLTYYTISLLGVPYKALPLGTSHIMSIFLSSYPP